MIKLLATMLVYHHNIKMLHWTCTGHNFDATHEYLDNLAKQLYEYTDVIAEIMMSKGMTLPSYTEAVKILENDDNCVHVIVSGEDTHSACECAKLSFEMFNILYNKYDCAHKQPNGECYESDIVSILDEHMSWIRKEIFYKMKLRMEHDKVRTADNV